jgi:hypothetical protein
MSIPLPTTNRCTICGEWWADTHVCAVHARPLKTADEITSLRAERDQLRKYLDAAQRRGEELRAQVAALEVDAARYRWLALQRVTPEHWGSRWSIVIEGPAPPPWPYKDQFDAAIDAALAARKGEA